MTRDTSQLTPSRGNGAVGPGSSTLLKAPPVPGSSECFGPHAGRPLPLRKPAHAGENLNLGCEGPRLDLLPGLHDASKGRRGVHVLKLSNLSKLCRYCRICRNGRYCRYSVETVETADTVDTVERSHGRNCHTKRKNGHRCMSPGVGLVAQLVMGLVVPRLVISVLSLSKTLCPYDRSPILASSRLLG